MMPEEIFPIFVGVWVVLGIISALVFFVGKNVKLKRKLWPPFVIGTGVLFVAFSYAMMPSEQSLMLIVPAVALITFLNLRSTRFCDSCGRTVINQNFFVKPDFCSKCGYKLQ